MKRNVDNKKASSAFIGRVDHIDVFMKKYNAVYDSVQSDNTCDDPVVFAYNGAGGIGKSTLIRQLNKRIVETNEAEKRKTFFVKVDFDNKTDTCEILQDIADQLRKEYRFRLPSFNSALTEYKIARGDNVDDCIDTLMGSPGLELVNFFSGGILSNGLHVLNNFHKLIKDARNNAIVEDQGDKLKELKGALPFQLGSDISANLEKRGGVLVIALDTYEKLVNPLEGKKTYLNDMWLKDTQGLIRCCKNTIWIIGGREPLNWDTKKWNSDKLIQTGIKPFNEAEGMKYLGSLGVDDADICNKIYEVTGGAPFFMKLCAEVYNQHKSDNDLTDDMFDISFDKLYERFVRYMDEEQMSVVSVLACLGRWNDELLKTIGGELVPEVSPSTYDIVGSLTIIDRNENGISVLQKDCQKALYDRCDSKFKSDVHKAAVELCGEKLTDGSKLSAEEYELYSSLYKLHGAALYGEDFGLTQDELLEKHLNREINNINSRLGEGGISADEKAELLLYLTKLYNEMYIYVDTDEHYIEDMTVTADVFLSVIADEESSKADQLKIYLANMLVELLPQKALQLYDEIYDRLDEILDDHNESVASAMINRIELINGASIRDNRKSLARSADEVIEAYKDIVEFYDNCGDEAAVCKWYRNLCIYKVFVGRVLQSCA